MTIKEASKELQHSIDVGLCPNRESRRLGIRSLEAWEAVIKEIDDILASQLIFHSYGDGLHDCLQIINKHLSEVEGRQ